MSCYCDTPGPTVIDIKIVTARKQHKCCECGNVIEPGDTYEVTRGLWEGEWETFKTCEYCAETRKQIIDLGYCYYYGDLIETLREVWDVNRLPFETEEILEADFYGRAS